MLPIVLSSLLACSSESEPSPPVLVPVPVAPVVTSAPKATVDAPSAVSTPGPEEEEEPKRQQVWDEGGPDAFYQGEHLAYAAIDDDLVAEGGLGWWGEWRQVCVVCGEQYADDAPIVVERRASSTLKDAKRSYPPANTAKGAFAGSPAQAREALGSAWCEGAEGDGVGEWIELAYERPVGLGSLYFSGGYVKTAGILAKNGRVKAMSFALDGEPAGRVEIEDATRAWSWTLHRGLDTERWERPFRTFRVTIDEVYPGSTYQDTCISLLDLDVYDAVVLH